MRIHHLALRTDRVADVAAFYEDVLALARAERPGADPARSVWLDAGGVIVMVERREPDEPVVDPRSLELTCFAVAPADAPGVLARLAARGGAVEGRTAYSVYFRDPDGRRVGVSAWPEPLT